jgi:hypothetical protein
VNIQWQLIISGFRCLFLTRSFDFSAYVHGPFVSNFFGIYIYSGLPLLRNSSTLLLFIHVLEKENNWIRNKDDYFGRIIRTCAFYVSKRMFRINLTFNAITLEAQLCHLTPYVTYRFTHKLYPNYTNIFYNTILVLVTDESNCIAGNH